MQASSATKRTRLTGKQTVEEGVYVAPEDVPAEEVPAEEVPAPEGGDVEGA